MRRKYKAPEETPYNTRFDGVVESLTTRGPEPMANIRVRSDSVCILSVPLRRVPKAAQKPGAEVRIFLTTMYGKFGVVAVEDEARREPLVPNRDLA